MSETGSTSTVRAEVRAAPDGAGGGPEDGRSVEGAEGEADVDVEEGAAPAAALIQPSIAAISSGVGWGFSAGGGVAAIVVERELEADEEFGICGVARDDDFAVSALENGVPCVEGKAAFLPAMAGGRWCSER